MNLNTLLPVPFRKDVIFLTTSNGEPYTSMRPIVENMGLAWQVQHRKLTSNAKRWGVTIMVTPSESGSQETLCMPVRKLPAFLSTINPKKVRPEIREKIELYQEECDDALWDYWTKGQAIRKPAVLKEIQHTNRFIKNFITVAKEMGYTPAQARSAAIQEAGQQGLMLPAPPTKEITTPEFFIRAWLNGKTDLPICTTRVRALYNAYVDWCLKNDFIIANDRAFFVQIRTVGALRFRRICKAGHSAAEPVTS